MNIEQCLYICYVQPLCKIVLGSTRVVIAVATVARVVLHTVIVNFVNLTSMFIKKIS